MGKTSTTQIAELVKAHTPFQTFTALGAVIGVPDLHRQLQRARAKGRLPSSRIIAGIASQMDRYGRSLLIETLARDANLSWLGEESDDILIRADRLLKSLPEAKVEALIELLNHERTPT